MLKKLMRIVAVFLAILCLATVTFGVSAATQVPFESYTYWTNVGSQDKAVYNRPMYSAAYDIDAKALGIKDFSKITDITFDNEGNLYLLDAESRIVILDKDLQVKQVILRGKAL